MENREVSSFRDPAGYIYYKNNKVYRRINKCYFKEYEHLMNSGLYKELTSLGYLVCHKEVERCEDYIIIQVEKIPFISYSYEWCFGELKDAAILTLNIQKIALKYGMYLKDASGYNVQFFKGRAIFIDTLSFDFYVDGSPWGAYGQFCRHFMAPLLLMRYVDENANCLLKNYIDGIPIPLANNILGRRGGFPAKQHIKWHSKAILKNNDKVVNSTNVKVSCKSIINMIDMMIRQIEKLERKVISTEWDNYYDNTNYDDVSDKSKVKLVKDYLGSIKYNNSDKSTELKGNVELLNEIIVLLNEFKKLNSDLSENIVGLKKSLIYERNLNKKLFIKLKNERKEKKELYSKIDDLQSFKGWLSNKYSKI